AAVSGIISMGPIYAWYPLLASLRKKEVPDFHLATFLGCRAVKVPLLPVMAAYFGWAFTVVLTGALLLNAFLTGLVVEIFSPNRSN
ncbi:MAG: permease, partial [bacterium]